MIGIIISIYLVVLIVLLVITTAVVKHRKRFEVLFRYDVDYVFYETARVLLGAKDSLYDYDNALSLLYHDKKRIFQKPTITYQQQFPKIQENIAYLEKLLQKRLFTTTFQSRLAQNYQTLEKVQEILTLLHTIISFWTLGINKIWAI